MGIDNNREYKSCLLVFLPGIEFEFLLGVFAALMDNNLLKLTQEGDSVLDASLPLVGCFDIEPFFFM